MVNPWFLGDTGHPLSWLFIPPSGGIITSLGYIPYCLGTHGLTYTYILYITHFSNHLQSSIPISDNFQMVSLCTSKKMLHRIHIFFIMPYFCYINRGGFQYQKLQTPGYQSGWVGVRPTFKKGISCKF